MSSKSKKKEIEQTEKRKDKVQKELASISLPTTNSKSWFGRHWYIFLLIFVLLLVIVLFYVYLFWIDVVRKDVYLELGAKEIKVEQFFQRNFISHSKILTDQKEIDFTKLGTYPIEIQVGNRSKTKMSTLHIVDTTSPKVVFQDAYGYLNYEFDKNDFIQSVEDFQETNITVKNLPEIQEFGDYEIEVVVEDCSKNQTIGHPVLHIGALKSEYHLEFGTKLKKTDLIYNEEDIDAIRDEQIQKINDSGVGEYQIEAEIDGKTFTSKIIVEDTLPPELKLKNVSIYDDTKEIEMKNFIASSKDASEYEMKIITEIPYGKLGKYDIWIEAVDIYGNKKEEKTSLTIQKDKKAPSISGLSTITIAKNQSINYYSGVKAYDDKDGTVEVSVNSNAVNRSVAGIYYATYTASDKAGNKSTAKRKIIVKHDQSDVDQKIKEISSSIGSSIADVYQYVKAHVRYNTSWGEDDPLWYVLTNWKGNCYVQASFVKRLLNEKGYDARLIWVTDKTHYWVIVNTGNDVWRHVDTAYSMLLATDEERYANVKGRDWDRTNWPAAN